MTAISHELRKKAFAKQSSRSDFVCVFSLQNRDSVFGSLIAKVPIKSSVWFKVPSGFLYPAWVGNPIWKNKSSIPGLQSWYRRLSRSIRRTERLRPKTDKLRLPTNTNLSVRLHDRVPAPFSRAPLPLTHATTRQDGRHHEHFRRRQGRQGPQGERSAVAPVAASRSRTPASLFGARNRGRTASAG
jgi:hypothetical protein